MVACGGSKKEPDLSGPSTKGLPPPTAVDTKVTAFSVAPENLNVDKVGMRDGAIHPDGNHDHAFRATVDGPFDAIFIVECNAKGEPSYGFRADTLSGSV